MASLGNIVQEMRENLERSCPAVPRAREAGVGVGA